MVMFFLILALVFVVLLVIITNIVIVPQSKVYVVERLGSYSDTWSAGLHIKIPFIERIAKKVSLKEQVADFPPQLRLFLGRVPLSDREHHSLPRDGGFRLFQLVFIPQLRDYPFRGSLYLGVLHQPRRHHPRMETLPPPPLENRPLFGPLPLL